MYKKDPVILKPFSDDVFADLAQHVKEIRRINDWPGNPYHDNGAPEGDLFNRWFWHNLPLIRSLHHSLDFLALARDTFGQEVKPSYCFLSMYGPEGVCPPHTDRPQCQFTIDLQIRSNGSWPIYVDGNPYVLKPGEALAYSGTDQKHYREPMATDGKDCTYMDLAFFHFVPVNWQGKVE